MAKINTQYPLGAHYLPLPNIEDKELLQFLTEEKLQDANGILNLMKPNSLLLLMNVFFTKTTGKKKSQTRKFSRRRPRTLRFFKLMDDFRIKKDANGTFWLMIPISQSAS
jgi:hypothetical protein